MGSLISCFSHALYLSERISLWITCTGLIFCLVLTITITLALGIGIGYNYCFVELQNKFRQSLRGHYVFPPGHPRWNPPKREGDARDYQEIEATEARRPSHQAIADTRPDNYKTPRSLRENLFVDIPFNTGNNTLYYHPIFYDSESSKQTESSVEEVTNDESTDIPERKKKKQENIPSTLGTTEILEDVVELASTVSIYSESSSINATEGISTTEGISEDLSVTEPHPDPTDETILALYNDSSKKERKLVIPISDLDLISFISKLSENKNYSIQIVTT